MDNDEIKWPSHYNQGKIQVTDFIIDQKLGWCAGNIIAYICRFKHKGQPLKDLKKAKWYIERLIKEIENSDT